MDRLIRGVAPLEQFVLRAVLLRKTEFCTLFVLTRLFSLTSFLDPGVIFPCEDTVELLWVKLPKVFWEGQGVPDSRSTVYLDKFPKQTYKYLHVGERGAEASRIMESFHLGSKQINTAINRHTGSHGCPGFEGNYDAQCEW